METVDDSKRSWERRAACREADVELFYREDGPAEDAALELCGACDVREHCLAVAMARREAFGVWGGTRGRERRRLFRRESRGRGHARRYPAGQLDGEEDWSAA